MRVKFGDLTMRQLQNICKREGTTCRNCLLFRKGWCLFVETPEDFNLEAEIELPDEEEKDDSDKI